MKKAKILIFVFILAIVLFFGVQAALAEEWNPGGTCSIVGDRFDPGPEPGQGYVECDEVLY